MDREGTLLRIEERGGGCAHGADVPAIVHEMGYTAELAVDPPSVEHWFSADQVDTLSAEEARVLAVRWARELEHEGIVGSSRELLDAVAGALLEAFRTAARTGIVEVPRLSASRFSVVLDIAEAEGVAAWINAKLGHQADDAGGRQ